MTYPPAIRNAITWALILAPTLSFFAAVVVTPYEQSPLAVWLGWAGYVLAIPIGVGLLLLCGAVITALVGGLLRGLR